MVDSESSSNPVHQWLVPLCVLFLVNAVPAAWGGALLGDDTPVSAMELPADPTARPDADLRLRSAYLMRRIDRYRGEMAAAREQLQRHFEAVITRLAREERASLSVALERLEAHRGESWSPEKRQAWRERLARSRARHLLTLKHYQLGGRFPLNEQFAEPTPIFVDRHGTACAVGYLMRESGWTEAVAAVAEQSNYVFIDDVTGGPVLDWILESGLTREEAALIQPAYRCDDPLSLASVPFTSGSLTFGYSPDDGRLSMNIGDGSVTALEIQSAQGRFLPDGANTDVFSEIADILDADKLFLQRADGLAKALDFGAILPAQLTADEIIADLSIDGAINLSGCDRLFLFPASGIVRWTDGQVIVGTEAYSPQPGLELRFRDLRDAWLGGMNLDEADFESTNLSGARLSGAILTNANFTNANLTGAFFDTATLTGAQLPGADLMSAVLFSATLDGANLSGADLNEARLFRASLIGTDLTQANLTAAAFFEAEMTGANLSGADLRNADLSLAQSLEAATFSPETIFNQWTMFPAEFDTAAHGLTQFVLSAVGDLDDVEGLTSADIDLLSRRLRSQSFMSWQFDMFDLNGDAVIDAADLSTWVSDLKGTWFGDANLDGQFDSSDLIEVLAAGQYEDGVERNSGWSTGDWNADGEFDTSDLLHAFQHGGYEQGPRVPAAPVPEPASALLALLAAYVLARRPWRRNHLRRVS